VTGRAISATEVAGTAGASSVDILRGSIRLTWAINPRG